MAKVEKKYPRYWKPLQRANFAGPEPEEAIRTGMEQWGVTHEEARARLQEEFAKCEYWVNDLYQVEVRYMTPPWVQLNIRHINGTAIFRDWRHFQQIKNQLIGEECEAIEIYPAESRLVDTSNKYHLWCCKDPTVRFKIGFQERDVNYEHQTNVPAGVKQRGW